MIFVVCFFYLLMTYAAFNANNMDPVQTASEEQSDQGSYCLLPWKNLVWSELEYMQQIIKQTTFSRQNIVAGLGLKGNQKTKEKFLNLVSNSQRDPVD